MVVRRVRHNDRLLNEVCSICLEGYEVDDEIRELPCRHYFHKRDIDIWLLRNRHCPLCKLDVLKATGYKLNLSNRENDDSNSIPLMQQNNVRSVILSQNETHLERRNEMIQTNRFQLNQSALTLSLPPPVSVQRKEYKNKKVQTEIRLIDAVI